MPDILARSAEAWTAGNGRATVEGMFERTRQNLMAALISGPLGVR